MAVEPMWRLSRRRLGPTLKPEPVKPTRSIHARLSVVSEDYDCYTSVLYNQ